MPSADPTNIRRVYLDPQLLQAVDEYAEKNALSRSEAIRDVMDSFTTGTYPVRKPVLEPVTIWISPEEYAAFTQKARASNITIRKALEIAVEERLR